MSKLSKMHGGGQMKDKVKRALSRFCSHFRRSSPPGIRPVLTPYVERHEKPTFKESQRSQTPQPRRYHETRPDHSGSRLQPKQVVPSTQQFQAPTNPQVYNEKGSQNPAPRKESASPEYDIPHVGIWPPPPKPKTGKNKDLPSSLRRPAPQPNVWNINPDSHRQLIHQMPQYLMPRTTSQIHSSTLGAYDDCMDGDYAYSASSQRGSGATEDCPRFLSRQPSQERLPGKKSNLFEPPSARSGRPSFEPPRHQHVSTSWNEQPWIEPPRPQHDPFTRNPWCSYDSTTGSRTYYQPVPDHPLHYTNARSNMHPQERTTLLHSDFGIGLVMRNEDHAHSGQE